MPRLPDFLLNLLLACTVWLAGAAQAETGITPDEIKIGMVNALSGPAAGLGLGIKKGSGVFFAKVNATGGIHGRKIHLISEDDGYEPTKAAAATEKLIKQDQVFALFGFVGTPTTKAVLPILARNEIMLFAPFTGADFLRTPVDRQIFNVRASYDEEAEMHVTHLTRNLGLTRIGVFIQGDAFGLAGNDSIKRALKKHGLTPVAEGRYQRNSDNIDGALASLQAGKPQAVIMVGTYAACAAFVKKARSSDFAPEMASLSFVGTQDFINAAGIDGDKVLITQVMPSPHDASIPLVKQYQADMRSAGFTSFDYTTLEGYVNAAVFTEALKAAGAQPTRKGLAQALEKLNFNLGGLAVAFSASDHQGIKQVYLTQVRKGRAVPVGKP
jgi:ABC-type branched-subunit amino acid transport system substrate-binding protein